MISTRAIPDGGINVAKVSSTIKSGSYGAYYGNHNLICSVASAAYGNPTGAAGDINNFRGFGPYPVQGVYIPKGTQTLLAPLLDATDGLDISQDQTDNDGIEYVFGGPNGALNAMAHTVGTTPASFIRVKMKIADVSGTDDCAVGFRKVETAQANIDDYDEMAVVNVISGNVKTERILNGGATATSGVLATWADAATKEIKVILQGRTVTFYLNGAKLSGSHTFDVGEVVVPFLFFLQATTTPGKLFIKELEYGRLQDIDSEGTGY
jgi:hypothetical protein